MSRRVSKKLKKEIAGLIVFLAVLIMGYLIYGNFDFLKSNDSKIDIVSKEIAETVDFEEEKLNILFFYVGQADSSLIVLNDKVMLIDAGNNEDGKNISNYLKALGITKIDYLVGTHADEDHIGGIDDIIESFDIGRIFMSEVGKESSNYKDVINAARIKNLAVEYPKRGDTFDFDKASFEVMLALKGEDVSDNDSSLVINIKFGSTSYLFMGDGETAVENERTWDKVNVLKVGHHGSNTSSKENFLKQVKPDIAVIEVGKDNKYNLPNDKTISRLEDIGAKILRTDINESSFWISSNGEEIEVRELKVNLDGN